MTSVTGASDPLVRTPNVRVHPEAARQMPGGLFHFGMIDDGCAYVQGIEINLLAKLTYLRHCNQRMSPAPMIFEPLYRAIGKRIRDRRQALRLSQERLAEATGLSRGSISNVEAGRQQLYLHHLVAIADVLEEDPREFLDALSTKSTRDPLSELDAEARQFVESAKGVTK